MSFFKSKRIHSDSKASSKSGTESESKSHKTSGSSGTLKSGAANAPVSAPAVATAAATNSKHSKPSGGRVERSVSVDATAWEELPVDSRFSSNTMTDKTLSISRSGRYKAKGKVRARLFSDESIEGATDNPEIDKRAASTLSTPEDRQTVLQAMAVRSGAGRSESSSQVKTDAVSPKWSATPTSQEF